MTKSYTVEEFCEMHRISKALFYKLRREGNGPKVLKIGTRTIITSEYNAEWVRRMEELSPDSTSHTQETLENETTDNGDKNEY